MTIDREKRRNTVLEAIIKAHISSAEPVGSKQIAQELGLSSATIRSVMFELETLGFVKQPHTSAGRVPTDLGYRKYVNDIAPFSYYCGDGIFMRAKKYVYKKMSCFI